MVLLDVAPLSLGTDIKGGLVSVIIPRNTTIPTTREASYTTTYDNQRSVDIVVLEGEGKFIKDCKNLGKFVINGIPPAPAGTPSIVVKFDFDENGILKVDAYEKTSGNKGSITIKNV